MQAIDSNEQHLCMDNNECRIHLTTNEVRHPEPVVAGGSNRENINHCYTKPIGITFC
jgi:hypothetical protein